MQTTLYYRSYGTKANPENLLLVMGDIGRYKRHLDMIGWGINRRTFLVSRLMPKLEVAWYHTTYRFRYYRYYSWKGLIEDEIQLLGEDSQYIKLLEQLAVQYSESKESLDRQSEIDKRKIYQLRLNL